MKLAATVARSEAVYGGTFPAYGQFPSIGLPDRLQFYLNSPITVWYRAGYPIDSGTNEYR